ncbi:MAG: GntP family permease, partial [Flavonifractor plautii]
FSGAVLVYGGVTTLVVVFSLYPIALSLFKKANLPRYLLPGAIAGGCFTFACANFPGTPNLVNVIPTTYLGTNTMAAPLVGVITGIAVMLMVCV